MFLFLKKETLQPTQLNIYIKKEKTFFLNNYSMKLNKEASVKDKGKHCETQSIYIYIYYSNIMKRKASKVHVFKSPKKQFFI